MKSAAVLAILILLSSNIYSQSIGISGFMASYNSYSSTGVGFSLDFGYQLSEDLDLTISSSFLFDKKDDSRTDLYYSQIPVSVGLRYFLLESDFTPYIAAGFGGNYSWNDNYHVFDSSPNLTKSTEVIGSYYVDISAGTYYSLNKDWRLNAYLKNYSMFKENQSFVSLNIGVVYQL